jgi:predicted DNA binding CopG/RHH family protein
MKIGAAKHATARKRIVPARRRVSKKAGARRRVANDETFLEHDAQLAEFETRDLGDDMRAAGTGRVIYPRARPTSILLDAALIDALRRKGAKRGLGYQTMLKLIVREHLDEY